MKWWNRDPVSEFFRSEKTRRDIQNKFPYILHATSGDDMPSLRTKAKKIMISYLIYRCGEKNVSVYENFYKPDIDLRFYNRPLGIKVHTGNLLTTGLKLVDTIDVSSAMRLYESYVPEADLVVINIVPDKVSGVYFIPQSTQSAVFQYLGRKTYLLEPNRNEVRISPVALANMLNTEDVVKINIDHSVNSRMGASVYTFLTKLWKSL